MLIKAAAGGGGKGMRVCRDEANLASALQTARNEAEAAFKNASVYLEKFIDRPRHVEIQILADATGSVVHCWDRDCTLQRRHQKLVEESPAADPAAATFAPNWARPPSAWLAPSGYVNAGTCEFLVDADNNFYFIEVNARIQVEHPVTEMVTGIDLVKQQIRDRRRRAAAVPPGRHRRSADTRSSAGSIPKTPTTTFGPRRAGSPACACPAARACAGILTSRSAIPFRRTTTHSWAS